MHRDDHRYAYVHGFASSSASYKGTRLRESLARFGVDLELPDLCVPSFAEMTYSSILGVLDGMAAARGSARWRLIGSSMGGYIAARWAELHPARVDRMVLLCPGFDLRSRWADLMGAEAFAAWKKTGHSMVADASGTLQPLHWGFVEDAHAHPDFPEIPCPTWIFHGSGDEVVPVELSRGYAKDRDHVRLTELDDEHALTDSLPTIERGVAAFFGLLPGGDP